MFYLDTFGDIIVMSFWDNVKDAITRAGTTQEWAAKNAKISFNTFKGWISKGILPRADEAVRIASALNCTVEELANGIKGREYILSWAGAIPWSAWSLLRILSGEATPAAIRREAESA